MQYKFLRTFALVLGLGASIICFEAGTSSTNADLLLQLPEDIVNAAPRVRATVNVVATLGSGYSTLIDNEEVQQEMAVSKKQLKTMNVMGKVVKWGTFVEDCERLKGGLHIDLAQPHPQQVLDQILPPTAWPEGITDSTSLVDVLNSTIVKIKKNMDGKYVAEVEYHQTN